MGFSKVMKVREDLPTDEDIRIELINSETPVPIIGTFVSKS